MDRLRTAHNCNTEQAPTIAHQKYKCNPRSDSKNGSGHLVGGHVSKDMGKGWGGGSWRGMTTCSMP